MKKALIVGLFSLILPLVVVPSSFAAVDILGKSCNNTRNEGACADADTASGLTNATGLIKNVVNGVIYLTAALSVIMIVYGGFRYATSGGDTNAVQGAKNVIIYAVVGLIVALVAYAIVNFVLGEVW